MSLQRRTPMKRAPFARKPAEGRHAARSKPLARGTSVLKRTGELARTAGLKARSPKMAKVYRDERVPLTVATLAERRWCEIRWDANCTRLADALHELLPRGRGGSITEKANTIPACNYCNGAVSDNPAEAEVRGFLLKSGRPSKAVPRHAAVTHG